jgi:hypothetical protein
MTRNHTRGILAIGIICLFVGLGIHPAFAVDTRQSMVNKAREEDCGCKELDDKQLVVLEKQLNRLDVYSKLLLVLTSQYPELKGMLYRISIFTGMIKKLTDMTFRQRSVICDFLDVIINAITEIIFIPLGNLIDSYDENSFMYYFLRIMMSLAEYTMLPVWVIYAYFQC